MINKTAILTHSDEVSGITVLADGTRCYWTEGRSSDIAVVKLDGTQLNITPDYGTKEEEAIHAEMVVIEACGADENRQMTPGEEAEWCAVRYPDGR